MMAGQLAMILAPLAMGKLSHRRANLPFYVTSCSGVIVIIAMLCILRMPGGKMAGREKRAESNESKMKKKTTPSPTPTTPTEGEEEVVEVVE